MNNIRIDNFYNKYIKYKMKYLNKKNNIMYETHGGSILKADKITLAALRKIKDKTTQKWRIIK